MCGLFPGISQAKQAAFDEQKKSLEEKLATEKTFAGRTFQISKFTVDALLKSRADLIQPATPPTGPQSGLPPGAGVTSPPVAVPPRRPVQAVTPPIAIPPAPKNDSQD